MPGSAPPLPGACRRYAPVARGFASSEGRTFGTHFVGVSTHPGTTALYRVMIGHATLWLLLCAAWQRAGIGPIGRMGGDRRWGVALLSQRAGIGPIGPMGRMGGDRRWGVALLRSARG